MATTDSPKPARPPISPRAPKVPPPSAPPQKAAVKKAGGAFAWTFKPFVNVTGWLGFNTIRANFRGIKRDISVLTAVPPVGEAETFEDAQRRLRLSEGALKRKARDFGRLAAIFALLGVIILFYAMYLGWQGDIFAFALTLAVSALAFANAFRYHFWLFQIKSRKLGCTWREWYDSSFKGEKH